MADGQLHQPHTDALEHQPNRRQNEQQNTQKKRKRDDEAGGDQDGKENEPATKETVSVRVASNSPADTHGAQAKRTKTT